jgi:hypothetical protein
MPCPLSYHSVSRVNLGPRATEGLALGVANFPLDLLSRRVIWPISRHKTLGATLTDGGVK